MSEQKPMVPPIEVTTAQFPELIRGLKAFLRQKNIDNAIQSISKLESDGNRFRSMLLREKQPWLSAIAEFDRLTLRGSRPLPGNAITDEIYFLSYLGALLREVGGSLPAALADRFRARFLDLHGKSAPALMEWETAFFYKRHGFAIVWNDVNVKGAEFCATRGELAVEVECKQFKRGYLEELSDKPANDLAHAFLSALASASLSGTVELRVGKVDLADTARLCEEFAALAKGWKPGTVDTKAGADSTIKGTLFVLGEGPLQTTQEADAEAAKKPHHARSFSRGFRSSSGKHEAIVVWLSGPRLPVDNLFSHMLEVLSGAAQEQLQKGRPGVLVVEIEGFEDAKIFRDQKAFSYISGQIFSKADHIASIIWRCGVHAERTDSGFVLVHDAFRIKNPQCRFPEAEGLPGLDIVREDESA